MATIPRPSIPTITMNTPPVTRLAILARQLDELTKDLDRVEFLEDEIVDKRKYKEATDLASTAKGRITGVRDTIASKGGENVAKGYK